MAIYTFDRPHNLDALHEEILAAVPQARPRNGQATMIITGGRGGRNITIEVPDSVPQEAIEAVVQAHNKEAADTAVRNRETAQRDELVSLEALLEKANLTPAESWVLLKGIARRVLRN